MINGFKEFILRGNVIDLAVAVVVGAAFTALVNSLVTGIFNPIIALVFDASSIEGVGWTLREAVGDQEAIIIGWGSVVAAVIQFLIVAVVLYFAFVLPINHAKKVAFAKKEAGEPAVTEETPPTEIELLTDIRELLANGGTPTTHAGGKHTD